MVIPGHSLRPIELISFIEMPNAPSPAKPTQGVSGIADLGADDRRKAVTARPEQPRRQIFAALFERRIGVSDRAVVADVAGDDGVARQSRLNRAPGLTRRHPLLVALARVLVPGRARIVFFMIHARKRLQPFRLGRVDQRLALVAAGIAGAGRKPRQNGFGDQLRVAADADRDRLGQADTIGVDVDLDDLRGLRPIVDAIAGKRRKRIEPGAERQHHVGLGDQLHRRLGAVVAERADRKPVTSGKTVIVLVVVADRRVELFGQARHRPRWRCRVPRRRPTG